MAPAFWKSFPNPIISQMVKEKNWIVFYFKPSNALKLDLSSIFVHTSNDQLMQWPTTTTLHDPRQWRHHDVISPNLLQPFGFIAGHGLQWLSNGEVIKWPQRWITSHASVYNFLFPFDFVFSVVVWMSIFMPRWRACSYDFCGRLGILLISSKSYFSFLIIIGFFGL